MVANEPTANELTVDMPNPRMEMSGPGETPTRFDQMLYRDTAVQGYTAHATAATFEVSSEKVALCRERVQEWLIENTPRTRLRPDDQRAAVEKLAIDRLEFLYCRGAGGVARLVARAGDHQDPTRRAVASHDHNPPRL